MEGEGSELLLHDDLFHVGMPLLSGGCWFVVFALSGWQVIIVEEVVGGGPVGGSVECSRLASC